MKIILIKDCKDGKKYQIIEVKEGYGINFLIKNNLGLLATKNNIAKVEKIKTKELQNQQLKIEQAKNLAAKLSEINVVFYLKAIDESHVHRSISSKQIYHKLENDFQIKLPKHSIKIETINKLGKSQIPVELHKQVNARINIEIRKES